HGPDDVRVHLVTGAASGTPVRHGGWAVAGRETEAGPAAFARADGRLSSELRALHGFSAAGTTAVPGGTAYGSRALLPFLTGTLPGDTALLACAARLTGTDGLHPLDALGFTVEPGETW
ncbi:hypothetical protein G3I76_40170, partial [Streptomyces sp. SID11233]|nr:hypothetical protein [Streptomyces sp. SID11233]